MRIKLFIIFMFVLSTTSCSNINIVGIGDYYLLKDIECTNKEFVQNKMTFQKLYVLLDNNAKSLISNNKINKEISKSTKVILSCGIFDLLPLFDFSTSVIKYDIELINQKFELLDYYIYKSFELLSEIKKKDIYIFSQFNPLTTSFSNLRVFNSYIDSLNDLIMYHSAIYGFKVIELIDIEKYKIDDFMLNEQGVNYLNNIFYE